MSRRVLFLLMFVASAFAVSDGAVARTFDLPSDGSNVVGHVEHIKTKDADTFVDLGHKYDVGFRAMKDANPNVDPWLPGDGTPVTIPTRFILPDASHKGIVINLAEMRLYYYPPKNSDLAGKVLTFPLGIGRKGWTTPLGKTHVSHKIPHPSWTVPKSIRKEHAENGNPLPKVVPAGPDNPLGQYALRLAMPGYLIHGTNKPRGIGMQVSHGCIRLFPKDIKHLFSKVSAGTDVNIVDQPFKAGWDGDELLLEAHPKPKDDNKNDSSAPTWVQAIVSATQNDPDASIDWPRAEHVAQRASGVPTPIEPNDDRPQPDLAPDKQTNPAPTPAAPAHGNNGSKVARITPTAPDQRNDGRSMPRQSALEKHARNGHQASDRAEFLSN